MLQSINDCQSLLDDVFMYLDTCSPKQIEKISNLGGANLSDVKHQINNIKELVSVEARATQQ